jgi:hypothetical protein
MTLLQPDGKLDRVETGPLTNGARSSDDHYPFFVGTDGKECNLRVSRCLSID